MSDAPLVKLCGLRDADDVRAGVAAGADLLGFVLVPGARRGVSVGAVRELVSVAREEADRLGVPQPQLVGVVGAMGPVAAAEAIEESGLDAAQLVGDDAFATATAAKLGDTPVIRVLGITYASTATRWEQRGARVVFDSVGRGSELGGTGVRLNLRDVVHLFRIPGRGIAGGLDAACVADVVAAVHPGLVDVSSGIENADGVKDPALMRAFVVAARSHATESTPEPA